MRCFQTTASKRFKTFLAGQNIPLDLKPIVSQTTKIKMSENSTFNSRYVVRIK